MIRRATLAAVVLLLLTSLARPAIALSPVPDTDEMVGLFEEIVFQTEYGPLPDGKLMKWDGPIIANASGKAPNDAIAEKIRRLTDHQLRQIAMITGLPVQYPATEKVNFLVFFSENPIADALGARYELLKQHFFPAGNVDEAIRRHADPKRPSLCFGFTAAKLTGQVTGAAIFIPSNKGLDVLRRCIAEEVTQVLGLWNDTPRATLSLFNDTTPRDEFIALTYPDMLLLRALYDQRIKPGMQKTEAMPLVRQIMPELMRR
jgi:hypothetical protein